MEKDRKYMCRKDDERIYQPRIHAMRIRELHALSERLNVPMTVIVDVALEEFIKGAKEKLTQIQEK